MSVVNYLIYIEARVQLPYVHGCSGLTPSFAGILGANSLNCMDAQVQLLHFDAAIFVVHTNFVIGYP